jgi:hypothetical protein
MAITFKYHVRTPRADDLDFPDFSHDLTHTVAGLVKTVDSPAARESIVANPSSPIADVAGNTPNTRIALYNDAGVANALAIIRDAAQNNTATSDTPAASVYADAGVTGVGASNLGAVNSALNSGPINGAAADTTAEVQAIVNAYQAILNSADGTAGNTTTPLTFEQYAAIGVTLPSGPALGGGSGLHLLNDVVDGKPMTGVDTVTELQALVNAAHHVELAAGGSAADIAALTLEDLQVLGVTGVTADNLPAALAAIGAASADLAVDTLACLQKVVSDAGNVIHYAFATLDSVHVINGVGFIDTVKTATPLAHIYEAYNQGNLAQLLTDQALNHSAVI